MQVGTYPTKNFATLGPSWLQPPFTRDLVLCYSQIPLTLGHRAGVKPYTSFYKLAESCVFTKQSPPPFLLQPTLQNKFMIGPPYSEVTGSICRVPSILLSQPP
jgi:hypothetical protein